MPIPTSPLGWVTRSLGTHVLHVHTKAQATGLTLDVDIEGAFGWERNRTKTQTSANMQTCLKYIPGLFKPLSIYGKEYSHAYL